MEHVISLRGEHGAATRFSNARAAIEVATQEARAHQTVSNDWVMHRVSAAEAITAANIIISHARQQSENPQLCLKDVFGREYTVPIPQSSTIDRWGRFCGDFHKGLPSEFELNGGAVSLGDVVSVITDKPLIPVNL